MLTLCCYYDTSVRSDHVIFGDVTVLVLTELMHDNSVKEQKSYFRNNSSTIKESDVLWTFKTF